MQWTRIKATNLGLRGHRGYCIECMRLATTAACGNRWQKCMPVGTRIFRPRFKRELRFHFSLHDLEMIGRCRRFCGLRAYKPHVRIGKHGPASLLGKHQRHQLRPDHMPPCFGSFLSQKSTKPIQARKMRADPGRDACWRGTPRKRSPTLSLR